LDFSSVVPFGVEVDNLEGDDERCRDVRGLVDRAVRALADFLDALRGKPTFSGQILSLLFMETRCRSKQTLKIRLGGVSRGSWASWERNDASFVGAGMVSRGKGRSVQSRIGEVEKDAEGGGPRKCLDAPGEVSG
jgi:hypothetical protein